MVDIFIYCICFILFVFLFLASILLHRMGTLLKYQNENENKKINKGEK